MQRYQTRAGDIELREDQIIRFPQGLPGFHHARNFTLIEIEEGLPFKQLLSLDDSALGFVVADPFDFFPQYEFELSEQDKADLQLTDDDSSKVSVIVIISLREQLDTATANLVGPVVINHAAGTAQQIILTNSSFTTRHRLFDAASES